MKQTLLMQAVSNIKELNAVKIQFEVTQGRAMPTLGPAWDSKNPKVCITKQRSCITGLSKNHTLTLDKDIPILTVSVSCKFKCCQHTFVPLELSFARTIHKFQGLQAGPIDPGRTPNVFKRIICNPDTKSAEARATGLL